MRRTMAILSLFALAGCSGGDSGPATDEAGGAPEQADPAAVAPARAGLIDLWSEGKPAFGVYVASENPRRRGETAPAPPAGPDYTAAGGERLAANPLYDYLFLNLEGAYDREAVQAIVEGMHAPSAVGRKALIVRIPSIEAAGAEATGQRVKEVLALGADGVTIPHVRDVEEAREALSFFREAGADVWSPSNPGGDKIAMLMVEDPEAVAQAGRIADLPGISVLATGIGSLRAALGGDAAGAEAGTQSTLVETKRAGLANMLTANSQDVEKRVGEGFLALLMQGEEADEAIRIGRAAAGR